ncbi:MAG TPA: hypothetical protein VGO63_02475 [Candidatus Paceibacterota bacterium]|jgi:hypothetical protein|nr:hypothetical protein [Candidatus Paceibacterota bacterium]
MDNRKVVSFSTKNSVKRNTAMKKFAMLALLLMTCFFAQTIVAQESKTITTRVRAHAQSSFAQTTPEIAKKIMGKNFFGVQQAKKFFKVNPSKKQLASLSKVPFSEGVLKSCKDSHILVAAFRLSILDIRRIAEKQSQLILFVGYNFPWYEKEAFAKDKGEVRWYLVRKEPVVNSTNKSWDEQQMLLSKDEETPKARIIVYSMIGHFLFTGERLFEKFYVRCSDRGPYDRSRVSIGDFGVEGLYVHYTFDDSRGQPFAVSSIRK